MTATVKRGAGRPAATARTAKHAQRTPLPPRAGSVASAKAPVGEPKGLAKALALKAAIEPSGWTVEFTFPTATVVEFTATRGAESLHLSWDSGSYRYESASYSYGDRVTKIRNASAAKLFATRAPAAAKAEFDKVKRVPFIRKPKGDPGKKVALTFSGYDQLRDATEAELKSALLGKKVVWQNRLTGNTETAVVGRNAESVSVVEMPDGERVVKFCCPDTGFRAFRLPALVRVGTGRVKRAAK